MENFLWMVGLFLCMKYQCARDVSLICRENQRSEHLLSDSDQKMLI